MFGFFKRSPKDKRKKASPERKEMCQNAPMRTGDSSPQDGSDGATASADPLKIGASEVDRRAMGDRSFAGVVRRPQPPKAGVKPCGHGTTAIAPHVPAIASKREGTATPPASPLSGPKKPFKAPRPTDDGGGGGNGNDDDKNTVTASMKLQVSLPATGLTATLVNGSDSDAEKKNLINQEAKYQSQLNELSKQLSVRDAEANKLRFQMEELQRDVFAKSAGMDRLQAELQAAYKESEIVRNRIRHLEHDLAEYRSKNQLLAEELSKKSEGYQNYESNAATKIAELEAVVKQLQFKIETLEAQLEGLRLEKEKLEQMHAVLQAEKEEEKKKYAETLEQAMQQKKEIERKWKEDFEKLRTINIMKEQQLLDDFEWKLREVQQSCKKKLEDKDRTIEERMQDAYKEAEKKMKEAEKMMVEAENFKSYETKIEELKGLTVDQEKALKEMIDQQEQMRAAEESLKNEAKRLRKLIEMEKENLQHMQRKHHQELADKERRLQQTLHQKRTEIAMYWEERLLNECGRLKFELEQIHNDDKYHAMEIARKEKEDEFEKAKHEWELKIKEYMKEIAALKRSLTEKDEYYHGEIVRTQTNTDRDIIELRRLMDKIDMSHHERFEKLVQEHDQELERITAESETRIKEVEAHWQNQVTALRTTLDLVKEQMETESQQKIEHLIQQHRSELDSQWENLIQQKSEAIQLVEDEYISKYKQLEEQFCTQQKSHTAREIELLKTIDSLKNELGSKTSTIDDLQSNCDTLEGGIQVLNNEIAQQSDQIAKSRREAAEKIRGLQETVVKLQQQQEMDRENFRLKLIDVQKQSQETIDHLQRKCQCLTKLFEEVRLRYERRESRQEDLNTISDLRQVIAEQEKDLACLNEEKRYFQMRFINMENRIDENASGDEDAFEDAEQPKANISDEMSCHPPNGLPPAYPIFAGPTSTFSIPPTIPECDE